MTRMTNECHFWHPLISVENEIHPLTERSSLGNLRRLCVLLFSFVNVIRFSCVKKSFVSHASAYAAVCGIRVTKPLGPHTRSILLSICPHCTMYKVIDRVWSVLMQKSFIKLLISIIASIKLSMYGPLISCGNHYWMYASIKKSMYERRTIMCVPLLTIGNNSVRIAC